MTVSYYLDQMCILLHTLIHQKLPAVIKVQIIWNSQTCQQYMSFNRALRSEGNYHKALAQIKAVLTFAFQDSFTLGTSPFKDLMFGLI